MNAPDSAGNAALGAVVVTYHPDDDFPTRLAAIARETPNVIIVDNSASADARARLEEAARNCGCATVFNPRNTGLAAALNQGFAALAGRGVTRIIAFDQDSTPGTGLAAALAAAAEPGVAAVGANWSEEARPGERSRHLRPHAWMPGLFRRKEATADLPDVTCVIASGTLFDVAAWRTLGGFDERLFLDLVDTDYCLRARAAQHSIRVAANAHLDHRRGAKRPVNFAGRTWWPAFMPPGRLRGLFRNRVRLVFRHGWRNPHWVAFETAYATKILAEVLFLEDRKAEKLAACFRGTWDGLLGRTGPIPAA